MMQVTVDYKTSATGYLSDRLCFSNKEKLQNDAITSRKHLANRQKHENS